MADFSQQRHGTIGARSEARPERVRVLVGTVHEWQSVRPFVWCSICRRALKCSRFSRPEFEVNDDSLGCGPGWMAGEQGRRGVGGLINDPQSVGTDDLD